MAALPQKFRVSLSGTIYKMRLTFCAAAQYWLLDIADADGNPIVNGIPLVTGALLLNQYAYLGFPGNLYVSNSPDPDAIPGWGDLGVNAQLCYKPAV